MKKTIILFIIFCFIIAHNTFITAEKKSKTATQTIKVNEHIKAQWDRTGYWDRSGSFAHVYGGNESGFFIYSFGAEKGIIEKLTISARMSAEFVGKGSSPKDITDVTLSVNNIEISTKQIAHDDFYGKIYSWEIDSKDIIKKIKLSNENKLRFEVKKDAENKRGLCIYGRALSKEEEKNVNPVTVTLYYMK